MLNRLLQERNSEIEGYLYATANDELCEDRFY